MMKWLQEQHSNFKVVPSFKNKFLSKDSHLSAEKQYIKI